MSKEWNERKQGRRNRAERREVLHKAMARAMVFAIDEDDEINAEILAELERKEKERQAKINNFDGEVDESDEVEITNVGEYWDDEPSSWCCDEEQS